MPIPHFLAMQCLACGMLLLGQVAHAAGAESLAPGAASYSRQAIFQLTYANRDLVWHGDPASPTALVYIKPAARPIATDFHVATLTTSHASPARRYLREARIAQVNNTPTVHAFTAEREKVIGTIDEQGRFQPNDIYTTSRDLLPTWPADPAGLKYDPKENALYDELELPGPLLTEMLDHLPLNLSLRDGKPVSGHFAIRFAPPSNARSDQPAAVSLTLENQDHSIPLAKAIVPRVLRRDDVLVGSFDNKTGTYVPESAYRAGAPDSQTEPSVTVTLAGEFTPSVVSNAPRLTLSTQPPPGKPTKSATARITVDGNFDDWRNVAGVDDPRGDLVPYLEYIPDVDLLEFKVAHDDGHIYLYARVAGQVGRSHPNGGRNYFYAYMDVDQNPGTGFLPTRDDDCYYGVEIGDDCEVQFEFVDNMFRKTFYGFCGLGGDQHVLRQQVTIGKSQYGRFDPSGAERAHYKSEYIYRNGATEITEDLKHGTSDSIRIALSPDGGEVEIVSSLDGFLKTPDGRPIVALGQTIDLAAGMECDSNAYPGKTKWAADSTRPIRGYRLRPLENRATAQR